MEVIIMLLTAVPPADALPLPQGNTLVVSALGVAMLIGTFLPLLNGLLTRLQTTKVIKGILTIVLNAVNSLIVNSLLADGSAVISWQTFVTWAAATGQSIFMYTNLWKPLELTSSSVERPNLDKPGTVVYVPGKLANVLVKSGELDPPDAA